MFDFQELEKLNMFEETEQENEDDKNILPLKSVKGSLASRRKLCNLEAMIDTPEDVDKGSGGQKPKITITSETPRYNLSAELFCLFIFSPVFNGSHLIFYY